jgi:hypothetical protein
MTELETLFQWYIYNPLGAVTVVYGGAILVLLVYGYIESQFTEPVDLREGE